MFSKKNFGLLLVIALAIWTVVSAILVVTDRGNDDETKIYSWVTFGVAPVVTILALYCLMTA